MFNGLVIDVEKRKPKRLNIDLEETMRKIVGQIIEFLDSRENVINDKLNKY